MTDQAPTTPDTVVVPVEPTEAMMKAGVDACPLVSRDVWPNGSPRGIRSSLDTEECADIYRAMLAARPAATPGDLTDLFQRLDEILVEESPMHPFGSATWEEATRVAIDMAKDALLARAATPGGEREDLVAVPRWVFDDFLNNQPGWPDTARRYRDAPALYRPAPVAGDDDRAVEATWSNGSTHSYVNLAAALAWQARPWKVRQGDRLVSIRYLDTPTPQPAAARGGETVDRAMFDEAITHLKAMSHVVPRPYEIDAAHAFLDALSAKGGS